MSATEQDERADLARADALDAQGRHSEAIDVLAATAQRGGMLARARLGVRLLMGDRAPALGPDGVRLLGEAGAAGVADAAALSAVLAGAGVHRPQNWAEALDWLAHAAQLGHTRARNELRVLAGTESAGSDWRALRARVDAQDLLSIPSGDTLNADPAIRAWSGFVTPAVAAWLVERSRPRLRRAQIYNAEAQRHEDHGSRTNSAAMFGLLDADLVQIAVQARIAAAAGAPFQHLEAPSILHYAPGEQFAEHFDFIDPRLPDHDAQIARDGQRVATFLVYLNSGYEGGETDFPRLKVSHAGEALGGLMFVNALADGKADVRTVHAGRPVRSGEKWVMSQFIRSRPALPGAAGGTFFRPPR